MIREKILKLREELNNSIEKENNYDTVYELSIKLDELISQYYERKLNEKSEKEKIKI